MQRMNGRVLEEVTRLRNAAREVPADDVTGRAQAEARLDGRDRQARRARRELSRPQGQCEFPANCSKS